MREKKTGKNKMNQDHMRARTGKGFLRSRSVLRSVSALCGVVLAGCMLLAGCNGNGGHPGGSGEGDAKEYSARLWFVNQEYIDSGDDSLPRYIVEERSVSAAEEDSPYQAVLTALAETPQEDGAATMLEDGSEIASAVLDADGKTVLVDFNSEKLGGGGSEKELCLIEQIVWTLTESFDDVKQVKFTVDGAEAETLMGHMDIAVPYGIVSVDNGEGAGVDTVMPLYE